MTRGDEQADDMVSASESDGGSLKLSVARTLKWNVIDRFSSQVLYTVTGVVLARMLTQEEFGLVGAILVFQAFAVVCRQWLCFGSSST